MKRISVVLFTTFVGCSVLATGQQVAPDGHLQRAGERTADQQTAEKPKEPQKPPADKAAPAPAAKPDQAPKVAAKPASATQSAPVTPAKKTATITPAVKPAEPKLINGIPEGAVQIEPYTYSYTDSEGKEWVYRRTPFGVSRTPRSEPQEAAKSGGFSGLGTSHAPEIKVSESGDELQFEQPSPFGVRKWTKKKTELTSDEQAAWDRLKKKD